MVVLTVYDNFHKPVNDMGPRSATVMSLESTWPMEHMHTTFVNTKAVASECQNLLTVIKLQADKRTNR